MSSPQPPSQSATPESPEASQLQPKSKSAGQPAAISTTEDLLLKAVGDMVDTKLRSFQTDLGAQLLEGLKGFPVAISADLKAVLEEMVGVLAAKTAELVDAATDARLKEQRELISRSDTLTAAVLEDETDEEDLLVRFDVSLLRKSGVPLKRVRGHSTMTRAMATNSLSESPDQLEGVLSTKIIRPLVGALQQAVTEALLPPEDDEPTLPPLLPPVEEPQTQSAEQGDRLQGDPGASGAGQDLH